MAQRQRRPRDISLTIHAFSLTAGPSRSYGLKLAGKAPPMVAQVLGSSAAGKAGLLVGDFVLWVSGRDTRSADGEMVLQMLREEIGQAVELCVARPFPVPVTDKEKMRALIVLQTKLDSGTIFLPSAPTYSTAVQDALAATQDVLGDLGLDLDTNQAIPNSSGQGKVQEVEVQMYDSDSLPSPPPSSESEAEKDPLLDFSRDDDLTYRAGQPASQSLADSVRQATQALESIQNLTASLQKKGKPKSPAQVSSEATFIPSEITRGPSTSPPRVDKERNKSPPTYTVDKERNKSPPRVGREQNESLPLFDVPEAELQWREPMAAKPHIDVSPQHILQSLPPPQPVQSHTPPVSNDVPPPVPPHGSSRDSREREREQQRQVEEREERRGREDTQGEIEREMTRKEKVMAGEKASEHKGGVVLRRQAPKAPRRGGADHRPVAPPEHVPLRKKQSKDRPAGVDEDGPVIGMPAGYKKLHPPPSHPAPVPPSHEAVTDLADQETAFRGLPPSIVMWRSEEVATWLAQLSPTLSKHYRPCFSRHDITGQTLMRLNLSKLKSMGIDNLKHCRQLALEIAKLKIYQESLELRELEEENQISFL